jgi:hypothetical protein
MKTDEPNESPPVFPQSVSVAVAHLKDRLQHDYQQAYPDLHEIIHLVLEEEEANAWELTAFPHLVLPDLVEAHIAKLNLRSPLTKHLGVFAPASSQEIEAYEPVFASCG